MGFLYENNKYKKTLALRLYLQIKKRLISFDRLGFQKCISNSISSYLQENSCYTEHKWSSQRNKLKGCMTKPMKYCLEINEKLMYASLKWEISKFHSGLWESKNCESVSNIISRTTGENDKNIWQPFWKAVPNSYDKCEKCCHCLIA